VKAFHLNKHIVSVTFYASRIHFAKIKKNSAAGTGILIIMFIYDHDKYSLLLEIRVHQIYVTKCEYRTQNNSDN
jgi:hypothetical protein